MYHGTYLDGGSARGVVHQGQFPKGVTGFEGAEGFVVVLPLDKDLDTRDREAEEWGKGRRAGRVGGDGARLGR